jgi:outer membrane protein assembly factor BamB
MTKKKFCAALLALSLIAAQLVALEPEWTRVLAGSVISGPVVLDDRIYVALDDRTLTCVSEKGELLWRKPLAGMPAGYMTVTSSGLVLVFTNPGTLAAFSRDGSFLWQTKGNDLPAVPMCEGRDGRIFIAGANRVRCMTTTGATKWSLSIDIGNPGLVSETGDGDLLLCAGKKILRISPFGQILERLETEEVPIAATPLPGGFAFGFASGKVRAFDVRNGRAGGLKRDTESIWEFSGQGSCLALAYADGTLYSVNGNGSVHALNQTDGSALWNGECALGLPQKGVSLSLDYGELVVVSQEFSCAFGMTGNWLWSYAWDDALRFPVITPGGIICAGSAGWFLYGYRVESRIKAGKKPQKVINYGILNGTSNDYGMPDASGFRYTGVFFSTVANGLASGTIGPDEVNYARRLAEILENRSGGYQLLEPFSSAERGRAASLLGQLGSTEYRAVLLKNAYADFDQSLAIGLLYGLASSGSDPDGETLAAIGNIVRKAGTDETAVIRAACDALYAVIRYSAGDIALEGTKQLSRFLQDPYNEPVRMYARITLSKILH